MLRIITSTSEARAKSYFRRGFTRGDYYSEGQEFVGLWWGKTAAKMGLAGAVDIEAYDALCENRHPLTGDSLTPRTRSSRRVGYDFNFAVTKSVSLVHAITGDDRIMQAFVESMRETVDDIEQEMRTRVRTNGRDEDRLTRNLVAAEFVHLTARPVDGMADPHLHGHFFVFNVTWDEAEQRFKAAQLGFIKQDAPYYEALFQNRLARKLRALGYSTVAKGKAFEIAGIPETSLRQFSRRTQRIEEIARKRGIMDAKAKDGLGAASRESKLYGVPLSEMRKQWIAELEPEVYRQIMAMYAKSLEKDQAAQTEAEGAVAFDGIWPNDDLGQTDGANERRALEFALLHCFERQSVVTERKLLETAIRFGVGIVDVQRLQELVRSHSNILRRTHEGREYLTTFEIVAEEAKMLEWVRFGKGTRRPLAPDHLIWDERLNAEQRAAIYHVLDSTDAVVGICGRAGTGKTTTMREAIAALEEAGHRVFVFAPTAEAAHGTLRKEGFAYAETVAMLLSSPALQESIRHTVWWIDEAGLVSGRDMAALARLAQEHNARVILSGDIHQHRAVDRGDALRVLQTHGGLEVATLDQIQRQEGLYREAVEELSAGKIKKAFEKLDALGAIREIDSAKRYRLLAEEYLAARREGDTVRIVSPTHSEIRKATMLVREGLKEAGVLGEERMFDSFRRLNMTKAERADVRSYREGWVIEMVRSTKEHAVGTRLTVEAIESDGLTVVDEQGKKSKLEIVKRSGAFEVCEREEIGIATGDEIRVTKNGRTADGSRLHNASFHTVKGFTELGDLVLDDGQVIPRSFGHITYGYASTSHSVQGKTIDRVLVAESSESFVAANRQQFYVSVSRGRTRVYVFTDDREELLEAVHASSDRLSAIDMGIDQMPGGTRGGNNQLMEPIDIKSGSGRLGNEIPTTAESSRKFFEKLSRQWSPQDCRGKPVETPLPPNELAPSTEQELSEREIDLLSM